MKNQILVPLIVLTSLLAGCSGTSMDEIDGPLSSTISTQTPILLRAITTSSLSATVNVDGTEKVYSGSDFADGNWLIDINVAANQMHTLTVKWYDATHLLLEETGQFFADPNASTIRPDLDYVSAGYPRFDFDCDGQSNLDEIIAGTDVTIAEGTRRSACDDASTVTLKETEFPWILRQHHPFRAGNYTPRVTSYEQPIQIISSNPNSALAYNSTIATESAIAESQITANIQFLYHPEKGKRMRFRIDNASAFQKSDVEGANCIVYGSNGAGYSCTIPFQWHEEHWYDIKFEQKSSTNWQGMVVDRATGQSEVIGNFDTRADIIWYRAQNGISYTEPFPAQNCRLGLPPISMRYSPGMVNGNHSIESIQILYSDCVKAGAGWSEGVRTINDDLVYSLTLGSKQ